MIYKVWKIRILICDILFNYRINIWNVKNIEIYVDVFFFGGWLNEFFVVFFGFNDDDDFVGYGVFLRFFIYCLDEWIDGKVGEVWVYEFV